MPSKTYLWIEDRKGKAGFLFWKNKLVDWIYAPDDEFLIKRAWAVKVREML